MAKSPTSSALEIAELFTVLCDSTAGGIVSLPPDLLVMWRPQVNLSIGRDGRLKHSIVNSYRASSDHCPRPVLTVPRCEAADDDWCASRARCASHQIRRQFSDHHRDASPVVDSAGPSVAHGHDLVLDQGCLRVSVFRVECCGRGTLRVRDCYLEGEPRLQHCPRWPDATPRRGRTANARHRAPRVVDQVGGQFARLLGGVDHGKHIPH